jgi:hypothetical protein
MDIFKSDVNLNCTTNFFDMTITMTFFLLFPLLLSCLLFQTTHTCTSVTSMIFQWSLVLNLPPHTIEIVSSIKIFCNYMRLYILLSLQLSFKKTRTKFESSSFPFISH